MVWIWNTLFFDPFANALVFLTNITGGQVWIAVILLTIAVKFIIAPFYYKSIKSQIKQRQLQPLVDKLKEQYKDKQEQSQKIFELYKEHDANPFSGCLPMVVQLIIILALYQVFLKEFAFEISTLYSFINIPDVINFQFLGFIDLQGKSIVLALLAGISQFVHARFSPAMNSATAPSGEGLAAAFQVTMQKQMKFFLPIMITVISYTLPAALALYWTISNIFSIIQEAVVKRRMDKEPQVVVQ